MVVQQSVELGLQLVNIVMYLVPNARALALRCVWSDKANSSMAIIRFACWFTVSARLGACCSELLYGASSATPYVSASSLPLQTFCSMTISTSNCVLWTGKGSTWSSSARTPHGVFLVDKPFWPTHWPKIAVL